jgi:hypothetical protein
MMLIWAETTRPVKSTNAKKEARREEKAVRTEKGVVV